jgi:tRNA nucleotidyltransferase (CCA-adding enzyme)
VALQLGVIDKLFPELRALVGSRPEEPCATTSDSEPFNDAFAHTKQAFNNAAQLTDELDRPRRVAVMLATLCHALGDVSVNQSAAAEPPALAVMRRLGLYTLLGYDVRAQVLALLREQARPCEFFGRREQTTDGDFRRLSRQVEIDLLYRLVKACGLARAATAAADDRAAQAADWFIERARRLSVEHEPPAPLLLGRHLLEMGLAPGPAMGERLRQVYELQLDDQVRTLDEARAAARRLSTSR